MKQKGFTLIELLAVIVILAIIALIATPIVLNIISESKESANLQSAQFYIDAAEMAITKQIMDEPTFKPTSCEIQSDGNLKCDGKENIIEVEVSGEVPSSGTITLEEGEITGVTLVLSEKTIVKNNEGKLVYGEPEVQLQSGLYDAEGNLIATWDELVKAGIDLEKDVEPQLDENKEITNLSEFPGYILSSDEKLSKGTKLVIDSSVTKIGFGALAMNTTITKIIIPNSVTSIGDSAFVQSTSLAEIIIPNSVISIGKSAFGACTSLEKIIIPNSVTSIGDSAFVQSTSLAEIIIPNSVTSIGEATFAYCTSLEKIIIPNSVTSIGHGAFSQCETLKEIIIPNSVVSIDVVAFNSCESLNTINYTGTKEQWDSISKGTNWDSNTPINKVINYNYVIAQN